MPIRTMMMKLPKMFINKRSVHNWSYIVGEAEVTMSCPNFGNALCVSSEVAFVMRAGLSMGEVEQPSPSNRLYAALF